MTDKARVILNSHLERFTFLEGLAGPMALQVVLNYLRGDMPGAIDALDELLELGETVVVNIDEEVNEVLYGRWVTCTGLCLSNGPEREPWALAAPQGRVSGSPAAGQAAAGRDEAPALPPREHGPGPLIRLVARVSWLTTRPSNAHAPRPAVDHPYFFCL